MVTGGDKKNILPHHYFFCHRFGFPGGVSWAILVARECMENPLLVSPSTIVQQTLTTLVQWPWSDQHLQLSSDIATNQDQEQPAIMTILTPSLPPTNTTHTVSSSSLAVFQQEANRALALIENERWEIVMETNIKANTSHRWEEAWQAALLPELPHFLVVEAKSSAAEDQVS